MSDRHKRNPISFRPAADLYDWLERHARETGKPVRRILSEALGEYRTKHDKLTDEGAKLAREGLEK